LTVGDEDQFPAISLAREAKGACADGIGRLVTVRPLRDDADRGNLDRQLWARKSASKNDRPGVRDLDCSQPANLPGRRLTRRIFSKERLEAVFHIQ
jgi:hypothetical protein